MTARCSKPSPYVRSGHGDNNSLIRRRRRRRRLIYLQCVLLYACNNYTRAHEPTFGSTKLKKEMVIMCTKPPNPTPNSRPFLRSLHAHRLIRKTPFLLLFEAEKSPDNKKRHPPEKKKIRWRCPQIQPCRRRLCLCPRLCLCRGKRSSRQQLPLVLACSQLLCYSHSKSQRRARSPGRFPPQ